MKLLLAGKSTVTLHSYVDTFRVNIGSGSLHVAIDDVN